MLAAVFHAPTVVRSPAIEWLRGEFDEPNSFVNRVVRSRARRASEMIPSAAEDIAQYARLELWRRWPEYDDSIASRRTFAVQLITNAVATFVQHQRRKRRRGQAINAVLEPHMAVSRERLSHMSAAQLRGDVDTVVSSLPVELAKLCELLKHNSATSAIHRAGLSRGAFYRRVEHIRARFEDAALTDYLRDERTD